MKKFSIDDEYDLHLLEKSCPGEPLADQVSDELVERFIGKIHTYECEKNRCKDLPDPIEEIKAVMRRRGLTNNDLKSCIGSSGNVCDVLMRRRPLSLRMIRNLHQFLGIPAEILIQPYDCPRR